jgi:uncharacterized protein (TIGR02996 family)
VTEAEWIAFLQRPEIPAFNRAMLANPDDDLPRLVFADWIEENHPHRRFVKQLRLSVNRPQDVLHCPTFPELRGVRAGLWRGRLALNFRPDSGVEVPLRYAELEFLRIVLNSGWLARIALSVQGRDGVVTSPGFADSVRWSEIEWLEIDGLIDWQPAISQYVLARPELFPKLSALVNVDSTADAAILSAMFASPLLKQLAHFDLGFGSYWPEVVEAVRTSPDLTAEMKARWGWPTDDGRANA